MKTLYNIRIKIAVILACVFFAHISGNGQVGYYTFANGSGVYSAIAGTVWQSGPSLNTNAISTQIPIGFDFRYNALDYSTLLISNNGFIVFGNQQPSAGNTIPISQTSNSGTATNGYDAAISAFGCDLVASAVSGANPSIAYGADGDEFVIQWTDVSRTAQSAMDRISFQIRLRETTNEINFVYGTCEASLATTSQPQVGIRGCGYRDWNNLRGTTGTAWTAPVNLVTSGGNASTATMRFTSSSPMAIPATGQKYGFIPYTEMGTPVYASLPAMENFDAATWADGNALQQLPNASNWRSWPGFGDRSWRRNDVTINSLNSGWSSSTGTPEIVSYASGGAAVINCYDGTAGRNGYMDYFLDFSAPGEKFLQFHLINHNGYMLNVYLSADGGATFTSIANFVTAHPYTSQENVSLGNTESPTCIVRFEGITAFGNSDGNIAIDNVHIGVLCSGQPVIGSGATATAVDVCSESSVNLSLGLNNPQDLGIGFNWTQSTTGIDGPYFDIPGSNYPEYTTAPMSGTIYFKGYMGCEWSGLFDSTDVFSVTIHPFLLPEITASPDAFCGTGGTTALTATATSDPGYTYSWTALDDNGNVNASGNSTANFTLSSTSTVQLSALESVSGCILSQQFTVPVNPLPDVNNITYTDTVCLGNVATIEMVSELGIDYNALPAPPDAVMLCNDGIETTPLSIGSLDDGGWFDIPIGFDFNFYGMIHATCHVSINGTIQFGPIANFSTGYSFAGTIPSPISPNGFIAGCANDLYATVTGSIRYWTMGSAPNRIFVLQYAGIPMCCSNVGSHTFQIQLFESNGAVEIHVLEAIGTNPKTIGVESDSGLMGEVADNVELNIENYWIQSETPITSPHAWRFALNEDNFSTWEPASEFNGSNSGNGNFAVNTTPFNTPGTQTFTITALNETTGCSNSADIEIEVLEFCIYGCMDPGACNYDVAVTIDDNSCDYSCVGCTDNLACNYDVSFTIEDGSCLYGNACNGCTDPQADNYEPQFTIDDGSCVYHGTIIIFNDLNGNGSQDINEPGLPNWSVYVPQISATIFSDSDGIIWLNVPSGTYEIQLINENASWTNSTPMSGYVDVPGSLEFGLVAEGFVDFDVNANILSNFHCTNGYAAGACIYNLGGLPIHGVLTLVCDNQFTPEPSYAISPDIMSPGFAQWNITNLAAGNMALLKMHVDGPGVEFAGDQFDFVFNIVLYDPNDVIIYEFEWTNHPTVSCSYDPNDISATPVGYAEPHYILPGERFNYLIRFQNTGNAPAEDIMVMDQLDSQVFDLGSFTPVVSSHNVVACLHDDGIVDFIMNDIYLPDSVHNEPASHGFVLYAVNALESLAPGTVLFNQASIFFELNPAVVTNQVFHTIFDCSSFTPMIGDASVCEGSEVTFDATQNYVESYYWTLNNELVSVEPTAVIANLQAGQYDLVLTTGNPLCVETHETTIEIFSNPTLDAGIDQSVCDGESVVVNASSNASVMWSDGVVNDVNFTPTETITLMATATNENLCSVTDELMITVNELPSATVVEDGNTLQAADGVSYQWYLDGSPIDGETNQMLTTIGGGQYYAIVTSTEGCETTSETITIVGLHELNSKSVRVYPNPMSNSAWLQLPTGANNVTLIDMTGRVVSTWNNYYNAILIERLNFASGLYQIQIQNKDGLLTTELLID